MRARGVVRDLERERVERPLRVQPPVLRGAARKRRAGARRRVGLVLGPGAQEVGSGRVALLQRDLFGREPILLDRGRPGAVREEQVDYGRVTVCGSKVKRSGAYVQDRKVSLGGRTPAQVATDQLCRRQCRSFYFDRCCTAWEVWDLKQTCQNICEKVPTALRPA